MSAFDWKFGYDRSTLHYSTMIYTFWPPVAVTLIRYMESQFQEHFASLGDKNESSRPGHSRLRIWRFRSYEPASRITAATTRHRGDIGRTYDPKFFKMTRYPAGSGAKHD